MNEAQLIATAQALLAPGKGLLAADESFPTIAKRFAEIDLPSTEETRRDYREMLFTTPGLGQYISGVILFDETIRRGDSHGTPFPQVLDRQGIMPGIKIDEGKTPLTNFPGEEVTIGLDGLEQRLAEYKQLGARFTKFRAVYSISAQTPTAAAIAANAEVLARFAACCQQFDLAPIVEPEVLMDGDHTLAQCEEATTRVLAGVFSALFAHRVLYEGMLLKPNMVLPGKKSTEQANDDAVADATLRCLRRTVPPAVPGIVFLSGGQDDAAATRRLNAMHRDGPLPWVVSFYFARALQRTAMETWRGKAENLPAAQQALLHRARLNSLASEGRYTPEDEQQAGPAQSKAA